MLCRIQRSVNIFSCSLSYNTNSIHNPKFAISSCECQIAPLTFFGDANTGVFYRYSITCRATPKLWVGHTYDLYGGYILCSWIHHCTTLTPGSKI
jgi:hypothetical protein